MTSGLKVPDVKLGPGDSLVFTVEVTTIAGVADSSFLDRLAERAYELEDLSDVLMGLNSDGSITASFVIKAGDSLEAANEAVARFMEAFVQAGPLREPEGLIEHPALGVPSVGVTPVDFLVPA